MNAVCIQFANGNTRQQKDYCRNLGEESFFDIIVFTQNQTAAVSSDVKL